ncbi:MAG: copper resistance D family protein, partial [Actinomycetales bacterium]
MLFDLLNTLAGVSVVGAFLSLAFLFPEQAGYLTQASRRLIRILPLFILAWVIFAFGNLLATLANLFELNIFDILDITTIRSYVTQTSLGKLQMFQVIAALLLLILLYTVKKTGGAVLGFLLSMSGLIAPIFQSHSSQAGSHGLAIGSLIIHVIALSCWVGAITSLLFMENEIRKFALNRISAIATWSVVTVVITGAVSSLLRLGFTSDWFTPYGYLILTKIFLLGAVAVIAPKIRQKLKSKLIQFEVSLLAVVLG